MTLLIMTESGRQLYALLRPRMTVSLNVISIISVLRPNTIFLDGFYYIRIHSRKVIHKSKHLGFEY